MQRVLHGSCACGRNQYIVEIPQTSNQLAQVLFDNSNVNRRHQAAPLTAWLRIPLSWYHSGTIAYFPDETHRSIRRTYTLPFFVPGHHPAVVEARRQFCGYCGTQLTSWHEATREDAGYISVTLGSLRDEDVGKLEEWGVLGDDGTSSEDEAEQVRQTSASSQSQDSRLQLFRPPQGALHRGAPWFEEMVEDGRLGRIKRQKGGHTSRDGRVTVEWEVVEWTGGADDEVRLAGEGVQGKRKFADL